MICHIDADSFFASVLQRKDPRLRGCPLLALGMGGGMVIAASYEAKAKGVKTGMLLREAKRLCPEALALPSDFAETGVASRQIESLLRNVAPVVEQMSIDEWFLDLRTLPGGLPSDCAAWAGRMKEDIQRATDISVSLGVAPTKTLAKMASEYRKPGGITVVRECAPHGLGIDIAAFLKSRPAAAIPGIGHRRQIHAQKHGWKSAWDIANTDPETIVHLFGRPGHELQQELQGQLIYPVMEDNRPPKSVSRCRSFRAEQQEIMLWAHAVEHMQRLIMRMRQHRLATCAIGVWLRTSSPFSYAESSVRLPQPYDTEEHIAPYLKQCFAEAYRKGQSYTQLGAVCTALVPKGALQLSFFDDPQTMEESQKLQESLDDIRSKFGKTAITKASALPLQRKYCMDNVG
jgi:DNA polymerase-4/DNA polymerase V